MDDLRTERSAVMTRPALFDLITGSATERLLLAGRLLIMFTRFSWVAIYVLTTGVPSAPGQSPTTAAQQDAMKRLEFLVGQWKGEGWMQVAGQRRTFKGTEVVQRKLDGLLVAIEGLHRGQVGEEGVVHHAFALVSYDDKAKRYRFQAFTSQGTYEDAEAKVSTTMAGWSWVLETCPAEKTSDVFLQ